MPFAGEALVVVLAIIRHKLLACAISHHSRKAVVGLCLFASAMHMHLAERLLQGPARKFACDAAWMLACISCST